MSDDASHHPDFQPSESFQPPALDTPPRPRDSGAIVAWLVIGLSVGSMVAVSAVVDRTAARSPSADARNVEFDLAARQLLGVDWVSDTFGVRSWMGQYWAAVDKATRTDEDRVRAVPLAYELEGKEAALARLKPLTDSIAPEIPRDVRDLRALY